MDDKNVKYYPYNEPQDTDYDSYYPDDEYDYDEDEYDDEYPEDEYGDYPEENEQQMNRRPAPKKPDKSMKIIIAVVIAALLLAVALIATFFGVRNAIKEKENEPAQNAVTTTYNIIVPTTGQAAAKYTTGVYEVSAEGSLRLRADHSMTAEHIMSVPKGTQLNIIEIYFDQAAVADEQYWGKTDYKGWTAWVCLSFMKQISSTLPANAGATTTAADGAVTTTAVVPGETTTALSGTPATTAATVPVATTAAPATSSAPVVSSGDYSEGTYYYSGSSNLHMREDHAITAESIVDIPTDTSIEVLEIYYDSSAEDGFQYWGRIHYEGTDGWVCMTVLD